MGKRKLKKNNESREDEDDGEEQELLNIESFRECLFNDHNLPDDPIDDLIAEKVKKYGFPHLLHFEHNEWGNIKSREKNSLFIHGPFDETEKNILARNFEIIMHSSHVRQFWHTMEEKDEVILALFGYCSNSKYYDSRYRVADIFPTPRGRLEFKFNLGRGLPLRTLMSCYEWVRRTYNPWRNYTEESFSTLR